MRNVVLAVVLHGSVVILFVLFLLWNAGKFDKHGTPAEAVPVAAHSSGVLPVVPVVRLADPVRAVLADDLAAGRAVCSGGFYARPVDGQAQAVVILVDDRPIPCP